MATNPPFDHQGQWNLKAWRLPNAATISSWACVCLCPQTQLDTDSPSGISTFIGDLVATLGTMGVQCGVPPLVFECREQSVLAHLQKGRDMAAAQFGSE